MRKLSVLTAMAVTLACLGGCQVAPSEVETANPETEAVESEAYQQPEQESLADEEGFSLDEVLKNFAYTPRQLYIVRGDRYIPTLSCRCWSSEVGMGEEYSLWPIFEQEEGSVPSSTEAPVLRLSEGESLITTFSKEEYKAYEVLDEGFYLPSDHGRGVLESYDEIEGVALSGSSDVHQAIEDALAPKGIKSIQGSWVSDERVDITVGRYEGTNFVEQVLTVDAPYCMIVNADDGRNKDYEPVTMPTEKTKEGYFLVDTSELSSGTYLVLQKFQEQGVWCKIVVS